MFELKKITTKAAVVALMVVASLPFPTEATAATVKFQSDGPNPPGVNDCDGDFGTDPNCVYVSEDDYYFDGAGAAAAGVSASYTTNNYGTLNQIAKIDDPFTSPDVSEGSILGAGTFVFEVVSGDLKWTYNPNGSLATVFAFSIKGGPFYNLWEFDTAPTSSGEQQMFTGWFSPKGSSTDDISHLTFFGRELPPSPVPLPAGGLLLITAIGGLGLAARRRRKAA